MTISPRDVSSRALIMSKKRIWLDQDEVCQAVGTGEERKSERKIDEAWANQISWGTGSLMHLFNVVILASSLLSISSGIFFFFFFFSISHFSLTPSIPLRILSYINFRRFSLLKSPHAD